MAHLEASWDRSLDEPIIHNARVGERLYTEAKRPEQLASLRIVARKARVA